MRPKARHLAPAPALAALALTLGACAIIPPAAMREPLPAAEGTAVPIGTAVQVGALTVEPLRVVEDSRCPINARCVWAGRLVIEANIARGRSAELVQLTLGEPSTVLGAALALSSGNPAPESDRKPAPEDYRFTFEPR